MDWKGRRVCCLPELANSVQFRAWGDKVVIGDGSGRVLILHLRPLGGESGNELEVSLVKVGLFTAI